MRLGTILKLAAGVLVIIIVAAVIVLLNIDFDRFKGEISALVEQQTGRKLTISGKLSFSLLPAPALSVSKVALANAAWGSRPDMAHFDRLEAEVELLPLLFGGNLRISRLVLRDVDLLLETDKQGHGNWQFAGQAAAPKPAGEFAILPDFDQVLLQNLMLTYRDGVANQTRTIVLKQLEASGGDGRPLLVHASAAYDRVPIRVKAELGQLSDLLRPNRPYPVQAELSALGAGVKLQGSIAEPLRGRGLNFGVAATAPNGATLAALAGIELPARPAHFAATVSGDVDKVLSLRKLDAGFGASAVTGDADLTLSGARPKLAAKLHAALIDLTEFAAKGAKAATPGRRDATDGRLFSNQPLPLEGLGLLDADITLDAAQVRSEAGPLQQIALHLMLNDRELEVRSLSGQFSGGRFAGKVTLSARQAPASVKVTINGQQIDVGPLLKQAAGKDVLEAKADFDADVSGSGNSVRALMAGLNGRTDLTMGKGRINNGYVDLIAADVLKQVAPWSQKEGGVSMNCLVSRFDIAKGLATSRGMLLDTVNETIQGEGTIDLGSERLALTLKPRPKEASLISLATPINVGGTLAHPTFAPDSMAVAKGVAGAVIGTAINPLGVLIPFVSGGSSDKNPCLAALQGEKAPTGSSAPAAAGQAQKPPPAKEGGIGGFLRSIGKEIDKQLGTGGK